jgi:hypothetical protein
VRGSDRLAAAARADRHHLLTRAQRDDQTLRLDRLGQREHDLAGDRSAGARPGLQDLELHVTAADPRDLLRRVLDLPTRLAKRPSELAEQLARTLHQIVGVTHVGERS